MFLASELNDKYQIPAALFCLNFLTGFCNSVTYWIVDSKARKWVADIGNKYIRKCSYNVDNQADQDAVAGEEDSATVQFHTNLVSDSSQPAIESLSMSSTNFSEFSLHGNDTEAIEQESHINDVVNTHAV